MTIVSLWDMLNTGRWPEKDRGGIAKAYWPKHLELTSFRTPCRWVHFKRCPRHRPRFSSATIDPKNIDKTPSLREGLPETASLLIWYSSIRVSIGIIWWFWVICWFLWATVLPNISIFLVLPPFPKPANFLEMVFIWRWRNRRAKNARASSWSSRNDQKGAITQDK